jgi:predicted metal-binding membrane protein
LKTAIGGVRTTGTINADRSFFTASVVLFLVSAALTIAVSTSMSQSSGVRMLSGWTMSTAWMRMPGHSWFATAVAFLGMWIVMMMAMMLPSLVPMLYRFRHAVIPTDGARLDRLTAMVAGGYFFVWTIIGILAFPLGAALASIEMREPAFARIVPVGVGVMVLIAGALQFTPWKSRQLACCREHPRQWLIPEPTSAWMHGISLGLHCSQCCGALIAILLVIGVMDLRAMVVVAGAITIERLAPGGNRVAWVTGTILIGTGLFLIALSLK